MRLVAAASASQAIPTSLAATARSTPAPTVAATSTRFLEGTLWAAIARRHGLDPYLLYAVALQETRHRAGPHTSAPWPYALRGPKGAQFPGSRQAAERALRQLMTRHRRQAIDVGLMQINLYWHGDKVADPVQLLDACTNLEIAAEILAEAIRSAPGDRELGVGRYHHWKDPAIARAYGRRVLRMVRAMMAPE
ncbi:lytic transglycosylase domain-containing protein [Thiorhodococcus minor]|uniref:Lytic transglycosylase domain-containing protein n=1 Tax=Thiorhodococcus minor TaxID=57489 RepID=A0A6M0JVR1_9GAMM|nr:lytic transglycosylase domain-containing protein [Thiorhodococcus minor]NEV61622.1 lytic transglycosylase domain-containing protein [Thiorhodococcus minor]